MNKLWIAALALALGAGMARAHEGHDGMKHDEKAEGPAQTVSGELVDMACYLGHGSTGAKHEKCSKMCVKGGAPLGVLTKDGQLYLVVVDHADETPYAAAKDLAGENAMLTGHVVKKGGLQALIVSKAEKR